MATATRPDLRRIRSAVIGAAKGFARYDKEADEMDPERNDGGNSERFAKAMENREKTLRLLREVADLLIEAERVHRNGA